MTKTAKLYSDNRVVMTLDAGGTNFRFSAMRGGVAVTETMLRLPTAKTCRVALPTSPNVSSA